MMRRRYPSPSNGTNREQGKLPTEPVSRFKLIAAVALSLALVGGLALSVLSGGNTRSAQIPTANAGDEFFGIAQGLRLDVHDFRTMARTGVSTDRFQLVWSWVQPKPGPFNWDLTDTLIGGLASHGIRAFPFIWGSPKWVTRPPARPPLDGLEDVEAWQAFLKAAVARYGRGGSYWENEYRERYGPDAAPLPIESWQIWNEPNLTKYFAPSPSVREYARLLVISQEAIKSEDPQARIVLAGMPGFGDMNAWTFLDSLYSVGGIKNHFDAVALHPYAPDLKQLRLEVKRLRAVLKKRGEEATPLWVTELGWGSDPPDDFGLNKGINGQKRLLAGSFKMLSDHREDWNVQRVYWFDWRDPANPEEVMCSFCASAGLLKADRTPKPAYQVFKFFARAQ